MRKFCVCLNFVMNYFVSISVFAIILNRKRKLVALLLLSYRCSNTINDLSLPHGAVSWSAICDFGIS